MKRVVFALAALLGFVGAAGAESVAVVQITDMHGQVGYQVMNHEEYAALMKEIKEETAVYPAIAAECKKEWEADKENKLTFQGNRVKPRSAKKGPDFMDREKADKKRSQLEDRATAKQAEEAQKEDKAKGRLKDEDLAKEEAHTKAFETAYEMITKKMGDKLGRPVPSFGFASLTDDKKEAPKKEEKKEKKSEKKEKK